MRAIFILLVISFSAHAEIYKTVHPDGSVSYSDVQTDGSNAVTPPGLTPTPAVKLPPKAVPVVEPATVAAPYTRFEIISPERDMIVRDNNGLVKITLAIEPKLQNDFEHTISILLDGNVVKKDIKTAATSISDVFRGRHSLSARLQDKNGKVLKTSNLVFFNMRRFSALNKKNLDNANKPANQPTDSTGNPTNSNQNPWPTPADPNKPQQVWPTLPDYSNPKNVWPTPPGTVNTPSNQ